jgi:hypothetical protein
MRMLMTRADWRADWRMRRLHSLLGVALIVEECCCYCCSLLSFFALVLYLWLRLRLRLRRVVDINQIRSRVGRCHSGDSSTNHQLAWKKRKLNDTNIVQVFGTNSALGGGVPLFCLGIPNEWFDRRLPQTRKTPHAIRCCCSGWRFHPLATDNLGPTGLHIDLLGGNFR